MEYNVGDQNFEPRYRGPFTVTERIGGVAYRLALPPTNEAHNVFHVSQLVPHHPRAQALIPQEAPVDWVPIRDEAGNPTDQYLLIKYSIRRGQATQLNTSLSGEAPPRIGPHGNRLTTLQAALR